MLFLDVRILMIDRRIIQNSFTLDIINLTKMERRNGLQSNILNAHLNSMDQQFGANFTFGSKLL